MATLVMVLLLYKPWQLKKLLKYYDDSFPFPVEKIEKEIELKPNDFHLNRIVDEFIDYFPVKYLYSSTIFDKTVVFVKCLGPEYYSLDIVVVSGSNFSDEDFSTYDRADFRLHIKNYEHEHYCHYEEYFSNKLYNLQKTLILMYCYEKRNVNFAVFI